MIGSKYCKSIGITSRNSSTCLIIYAQFFKVLGGLGGPGSASWPHLISNLDNTFETGLYVGNGTPVAGYESVVLVINAGRNRIAQIAIKCGDPVNFVMKIRSYSSSTLGESWNEWKTVAFS